MSHADKVFYNFWSIAMLGLPIINMPYGRTDVVRNKGAIELLKSDYTHILMLDIDHLHPAYIVHNLARWVVVDPKIEVVGGLNFRRGAPFDPCCFLHGKNGDMFPPSDWEKGLMEVDAIGTGSILISRKVFETVPPPWFWNDYSKVWEDKWPGEDMGFSKNCREHGIRMWVDTTTTSPHLIDAVVEEESFRQYQEDNPQPVIDIEEFERYEPPVERPVQR